MPAKWELLTGIVAWYNIAGAVVKNGGPSRAATACSASLKAAGARIAKFVCS